MEELDYWRLCEELNIVQAALLVIGEDPNVAEYVEGWGARDRPNAYIAARMAICGGLKNFVRYKAEINDLEAETGQLRIDHRNVLDLVQENKEYLSSLYSRSISGTLVQETDYDMNGNSMGFIEGTIDVYKSMVNADSLKQWLRLKGFTTGFFFPEPIEIMDFLDPLNPRYAPKLAATVRAWQAVTDAGKKSPKQALDKWLREHAAEYNLTNDEGKPIENAIENAIEECSKVANWNTKGGATKTPS